MVSIFYHQTSIISLVVVRRLEFVVSFHETHTWSHLLQKLSESDIHKMFKFLFDNKFVMFAWRVIEKSTFLYMQTYFLPTYTFYSYKACFVHMFLRKNEKKLVWSIYFTFCYIDGVWSPNDLTLVSRLIASISLDLTKRISKIKQGWLYTLCYA